MQGQPAARLRGAHVISACCWFSPLFGEAGLPRRFGSGKRRLKSGSRSTTALGPHCEAAVTVVWWRDARDARDRAPAAIRSRCSGCRRRRRSSEIENARRALAKSSHPDVGGSVRRDAADQRRRRRAPRGSRPAGVAGAVDHRACPGAPAPTAPRRREPAMVVAVRSSRRSRSRRCRRERSRRCWSWPAGWARRSTTTRRTGSTSSSPSRSPCWCRLDLLPDAGATTVEPHGRAPERGRDGRRRRRRARRLDRCAQLARLGGDRRLPAAALNEPVAEGVTESAAGGSTTTSDVEAVACRPRAGRRTARGRRRRDRRCGRARATRCAAPAASVELAPRPPGVVDEHHLAVGRVVGGEHPARPARSGGVGDRAGEDRLDVARRRSHRRATPAAATW